MGVGTGKHTTPAILFSLGIVAIAFAWLATTPPAAAPDEAEHYTRALSVGRGEWLGRPVDSLRGVYSGSAEAQSNIRTSRSVDTPARLATPQSWFCLRANHESPASCVDNVAGPAARNTTQGTRPPFAYIVPGAAAVIFGSDPFSALYVGRLAGSAVSLALLLLAIWTVWDGTRSSLIGPALALSPGVLWITALISPSSQEVAAGVLMAAVVVRVGRTGSPVGTGWWLAATLGGVILATARPLGPLWVLIYLVLILLVARPAGTRALLRHHPRAAAVAALFVFCAVAASVSWQLAVPSPGVSPTAAAVFQQAGPALLSVPETVGEEIGVFGSDDVLMPRWAYGVWGGALVLVIGVALLRGRRRDFRVVELLLVGTFMLRWLLDLFYSVTTGTSIQGRHLLPVTVVVAMLAGETINRNAAATGRRGWLLAVVAVTVATVQFVGWYSAAQRFAVGSHGSWWILEGTRWAPAGGWIPWLVLVSAGCIAIALSMLPAPVPARDGSVAA